MYSWDQYIHYILHFKHTELDIIKYRLKFLGKYVHKIGSAILHVYMRVLNIIKSNKQISNIFIQFNPTQKRKSS